jgi:hypothetical protein
LIGAYSIGLTTLGKLGIPSKKKKVDPNTQSLLLPQPTGIFAKRKNFTNVNNAQFRSSKAFLLNFYN